MCAQGHTCTRLSNASPCCPLRNPYPPPRRRLISMSFESGAAVKYTPSDTGLYMGGESIGKETSGRTYMVYGARNCGQPVLDCRLIDRCPNRPAAYICQFFYRIDPYTR